MLPRHTILAALFIALCAVARSAYSEVIPSDVKKVITFIFVADAKGQPVPNGTGFFVTVKGEGGRGLYGYLVTAKHVLQSGHNVYFDHVYVRLNRINGDAQFAEIPLTQDGHSIVYTNPDPTVDIVVIPGIPRQDIFDFKAIPDDMISTKETFSKYQIGEGTDVFFAGLFVNYYGEHKNIPVFRFGKVAMFPDQPIPWPDVASAPAKDTGAPVKTEQLYLLETQSYGGNSGAPVFFFLGSDRTPGSITLGPGVIALAGIMKGYFNQPSQIEILQTPTANVPVVRQNLGIAAVTPAYLLHDILFSDELIKYRAEHPLEGPAAPK
jgi:hypothetical protein